MLTLFRQYSQSLSKFANLSEFGQLKTLNALFFRIAMQVKKKIGNVGQQFDPKVINIPKSVSNHVIWRSRYAGDAL